MKRKTGSGEREGRERNEKGEEAGTRMRCEDES